MKHLLNLIAVFTVIHIFAQTPVSINKDSVSKNDKIVFACKEKKIDKWTKFYAVISKDGKPQAQLTFSKNGAQVLFYGTFASLGYYYECNYPSGTGIETVLESYITNKVMVDDKANYDGLLKYCTDRNITLRKNVLPPASTSTNQNTVYSYNSNPKNNSTSTKTQEPSLPTNVSFTIKNNGPNTLKYFIGTKPKYGSGRTSSIGGNTRTSEHGTVGDQICIVDNSDNPISCITISNSMGTIYINSKGTGFGDN